MWRHKDKLDVRRNTSGTIVYLRLIIIYIRTAFKNTLLLCIHNGSEIPNLAKYFEREYVQRPRFSRREQGYHRPILLNIHAHADWLLCTKYIGICNSNDKIQFKKKNVYIGWDCLFNHETEKQSAMHLCDLYYALHTCILSEDDDDILARCWLFIEQWHLIDTRVLLYRNANIYDIR